jgi:TP901-1 family phage major tail protein
MAKFKGSDFLVQRYVSPGVYQTVGALKSNSLSINREAVDVTTKTDNKYRQLLAGAGICSIDVSGSGVVDNTAAFKAMMADHMAGNIISYKLTSGQGDIFTGLFQINSIERNGEFNGAEQFSCSLASAGDIVYTP